jgi:hypothetical protein
MNLREKQVYDNFPATIDVIIRQKPDVLVHAGDLFDTVRPRTRAYTTVPGAPGGQIPVCPITRRIAGKYL